jgi:cell division protein FtsL
MIFYIQKEKILRNIHTLNDLNKQIDEVFRQQRVLIEQELNLRLELFRLKEEVFKLESKIAKEVTDAFSQTDAK